MDLGRTIDLILGRGDRGERALILAVLEDSIDQYCKGCPDASNWIFGEPMNGAEHDVSFSARPQRLDLFDGDEVLTIEESTGRLDIFGTKSQSAGFDFEDVSAYLNIPAELMRDSIRRRKKREQSGVVQLNFYARGE
jgi:hypothetical protein